MVWHLTIYEMGESHLTYLKDGQALRVPGTYTVLVNIHHCDCHLWAHLSDDTACGTAHVACPDTADSSHLNHSPSVVTVNPVSLLLD